jgi:TonB family protein
VTKGPEQEPELHLLLEDYSARQFRALAPGAELGLPGDEPVFELETADERSRRWLKKHGDQLTIAADDSPLRLLIEDFQPAQRFRERTAGLPEVVLAGSGATPDFAVFWDSDRSGAKRMRQSRWQSLALHLALLLVVVLMPRLPDSQSPTEPDPGHEYTRITLSAPSPEQIAQLTESARGDEGESQRLAVAAAPDPVIAPEVQLEPTPAPMQPLLPEPEAEPAPTARTAQPEPVAAPDPAAAQTPVPDEFQRGAELATNPLEEEPPPAIRAPAQEKPKLQLENPRAYMPAPNGPIQIGEVKLTRGRDSMVEAAQNQMSEQRGASQSVGEGVGASAVGGYSAPSKGNIGSGVELLSDPDGVDFRPYLLQVLNSVRRNWFAVIPESARLGLERGRVAIQFSISREGDVPKLVIASSAQSPPLDRASVAGVSASQPFPPLPAEFTGDEIRVQLVFLYNTK